LSSLPESQLPEDLRRMAPSERQVHVERQMSERRALNQQLSELVSRRDRHIADARSKAPRPTGDSFDRAVERTLRSQIAR
jgi:hypothetical protein